MTWYYRRNLEVAGPFPLPAIERYVILGRLRLDDLVKNGDGPWIRIGDCPDLETACRLLREGDKEALSAARRFSDERNKARRSERGESGIELRKRERRKIEPQEILELRINREKLYKPRKERSWMGYLLIACIVGLAAAAILFYQPVNPIRIGIPWR